MEKPFLYRVIETISFCLKPCRPDIPQCFQFVVRDVVPFVFRKAIKEHRSITGPTCEQQTKPARAALSCSCNPLLDDAAAQVGVHDPALRTFNRFTQTVIVDPLLSRIANEPLCFKNPHALPLSYYKL